MPQTWTSTNRMCSLLNSSHCQGGNYSNDNTDEHLQDAASICMRTRVIKRKATHLSLYQVEQPEGNPMPRGELQQWQHRWTPTRCCIHMHADTCDKKKSHTPELVPSWTAWREPDAKGGTAVMTMQAKQAAPPANLFTKHKGISIWYRNTHAISNRHKICFSSCFLIPIVATCWTRL